MLSLSRDQLVTLSWLILAAPLLALLLDLVIWLFRQAGRTTSHLTGLAGWATRLLSGVSLACSILLAMRAGDALPIHFGLLYVIDFYLDALSIYFLLLVNLVAFFASWYTVQFLNYDRRYGTHHEPELFHLFFNAFHLTMLIVPMVDNLLILWMAIELTTLASTLLVRYRRRRKALEASWKYIIITTAGIVFALFGTLLLADAIKEPTCQGMAQALGKHWASCDEVPGLDLMRWSLLARRPIAETLDPKLMPLAFMFVLVGYGAKAGFAPMHTWLPDGHGEAPSPVSALLSGVLLKSALYAILRFNTITILNRPENARLASNVLLLAGLLSLALATPFILKRNRFKRVLAYHSLEHMGIIVFGIGIGGLVGLFGALLHALNHALTKAFMFLAFQNVRHVYAVELGAQGLSDDERLEDQMSGVLQGMPVNGTLLLLGGLGLVGSPPFNIFLSEFIILWAAFDRVVHQSGSPDQLPRAVYAVAVGLFLVSVTLIFAGLVGHLGRLLLGRAPFAGVRDHVPDLIPLVILLGVIGLFGVWLPTTPVNFPQLLNQAVCILQEGAVGVCQP